MLKASKIAYLHLMLMVLLCIPHVSFADTAPTGAPAQTQTQAPVSGASRFYQYRDIDVTLRINKDTTIDVAENQWFEFHGEYHQGYRSIPLAKIDAITDIQVIDSETNKPLTYSSKALDKTQPASWGQYTYYRQNGAMNIEWYYNLKDTAHHFTILYKVHGGLTFNDSFDELYWNVFTDYDVPVGHARAVVILPQNADQSHMKVKEYLSGGKWSFSQILDKKTFVAEAVDLQPKAKFTIAAGWPKGIVDQSAYTMDFLKTYWGIFASIAAVIFTGIFALLHWFFTEKFRKGRGVVVAQYDAPHHLPPAMGEVIVNETMSPSTWAATVVDLAVRGLIQIQEDELIGLDKYINSSLVKNMFRFILFLALFGLSLPLVNFIVQYNANRVDAKLIALSVFLIFFFFSGINRLFISGKLLSSQKNYTLKLKDTEYKNHIEKYNLKPYEIELMDAFFATSPVLSIAQIKNNATERIRIAKAILETEKSLYKDVSGLGVYSIDIVKEKKWGGIVGGLIIGLIFIVNIFGKEIIASHFWSSQQIVFFCVAFVCCMYVLYRVFFDAKLNMHGNEAREEWLGFKLYLETAERYRVQNLTPEIFEKFLPYAMIFGIEKQWAKNFSSLTMKSPDWYSGSVSGGAFGTTSSFASGSGFSATAFSAGLSASLVSSLSSAGASSSSSASGGGGSAGGGGGGGGGGAS